MRVMSSAFALSLLLCIGVSQAAPAEVQIKITKFKFEPAEVTVQPGTRIRWVNLDDTPHTVLSAQGQEKVIASKAMDTDDKYELVIGKEGDYSYFCTVHPFMTGIIHVRKR